MELTSYLCYRFKKEIYTEQQHTQENVYCEFQFIKSLTKKVFLAKEKLTYISLTQNS